MSKVITVRPDELQFGYRLLLQARCQASAKTMPTPPCDDQRLRRLCKMAASMPVHYNKSLALQIFFSSPQRKCHLWVTAGPRPFVSNAVNKAASFLFFFFFEGLSVCILLLARLFVVMRDIKHCVMHILSPSPFIQSSPGSGARAAGQK